MSVLAGRGPLCSAQWPAPRPLEGIKSRKRAIFELSDAVLSLDGSECKVGKVSLALSSRVAAVGPAGRALVDVLLGVRELVSGSVNRHGELVVSHLGPHLADEAGVASALDAGPHVLVLSQAAAGDERWAGVLREIVGSEGLQNFQGAVVLHVEDEKQAAAGLCTTRWVATGKRLHAEEVCTGISMMDDICGGAPPSPGLTSLHAEVSKLALACFDDSVDDGATDISSIAREKGWTVAALAFDRPPPEGAGESQLGDSGCGERDFQPPDAGERQLVGYVTYHAEPALEGLYLARVAVVPEYRRRGHASRMVHWMLERAQAEGYHSLWVHAVPDLQGINLALGFAYVDPADAARADEERTSSWMVLHSEDQKAKEDQRAKEAMPCKRGRKVKVHRGRKK